MSENHGKVWWSELMTRDVAGAKAYYKQMCGWEYETMPMPEGDYHLGMVGGAPTVGIMDMSDLPNLEGVPPHWMSYFAVDDIDAVCAATKTAGGKVLREPFDVPGTGRIAILEDPTGAAMGMMTPEPMPS